MKQSVTILFLLLLPLAILADKQPETLESLKARANAAQGKQQVELLTKVAEQELKAANAAYAQGNAEQAQRLLAELVDYGTRAAKAASATGKRMKQTEIALRQIGDELEALRKSLDTDDRPPVADAIQKLEAARTNLLNTMFRK